MRFRTGRRCTLATVSILGAALAAFGQDHAAPSGNVPSNANASATAEIEAAQKTYDQQGPKAALPGLQTLLAQFQKENDRHSEAIALGMLANCFRKLDEYGKALDYAQRGLSLKTQLGDVKEQGRSYNQLGLIYWEESDYSLGAQNFEHAIQIANQTGDRQLEASALNNLGLVEGDLGDYAKAAPEHERALEISREIDFKRGESDALGNLGGVKMLLGRFGEAIPYYEEALKIDEERGFKPRESLDLGNLGKCQAALGRTDDALTSFDRAIQLSRDAGVSRDLADWQRGKGDALERAGKYQAAIAEYGRAQKAYETAGLKRELANLLNSTGTVHMLLGDVTSGERDFSRGRAIAQEIHNPAAIVLNQLSLGDIATRRFQFDRAAQLFSEGISVARRAGDLAAEADGLMLLARTQLSAGKFASAEREGIHASEVAKEMRNPPTEAEALVTLGDVLRARRDAADALEKYDAAAEIQKSFADPELKWRLHYGRGQAMEALNRLENARSEYLSAIATIETVRSELGTERYRAGYLQDRYQVYVALVELLLKLQKPDEAFVYSERMRARSYLDQLSRGGRRQEVETSEETALRERIGWLRHSISDEWADRQPQRQQKAVEQFSVALSEAERAYEELLDRKSETTSQAASTSVDLAKTQELLTSGSAVIEYVVGQRQLDIIVIGRSEAHAVAVPIAKSQLESRLELLRYFIARPETEQWRGPAASLRKLLVDPVEKAGWLRGISRLYIAPDDVLNYVPFTALPAGSGATSRFLVQDYVIGYVPTVAVLQAGAAGNRADGVMAMAPAQARLRRSGPEAREVVRISPENSRLLDGRNATETAFKESAGNFDVLHLATHGYLNRAAPLLSALELEPDAENDGRLEVHEILQLKLKAQLVTLSACETALGSGYFTDVPAGDEFVGLTRAFLSAGARSVVASLWQVDDRSTMKLMERFYRERTAGGGDSASALAKAQREMSKAGGQYSHPYYWAPFVAVGN